MIIRQEKKEDFDKIYKLVELAFKTAQVSDGKEQDFVLKLRAGAGYVPELALVAEKENEIIGHIMLTKQFIETQKGNSEGLLLAPLTVAIEWRNKGIGIQLVKESFKLAKIKGYKSVFVVGNPAYYSRFGFKQSTKFGISNTQGIPEQYVQACELVPGALYNIQGYISF